MASTTSDSSTARETTTQSTNVPDKTTTSYPDTPDEILPFGQSYVDTGLEITVDKPEFTDQLVADGETYEMPDGEQLVFVPVSFRNTTDEFRPIDGPLFSLETLERQIQETNSIRHPNFDPSIDIWRLDEVPTTQRWSAQGGSVEPGEQIDATAVFQLSNSIDRSAASVLYDAARIADDRFGTTVIKWE
ncbi:hypothetical protein ACH9L7_18965 (plasmid) [Haloferax sp. S1W]|uniref:hypothetical protein n=1 Tax=Haloferax sp. S1W TaxID=3377110 RepID=UPI0037CA767E